LSVSFFSEAKLSALPAVLKMVASEILELSYRSPRWLNSNTTDRAGLWPEPAFWLPQKLDFGSASFRWNSILASLELTARVTALTVIPVDR